MKNLLFITFFLFISNSFSQTFTFETAGNFADAVNWDVQPTSNGAMGFIINENETVRLTENCDAFTEISNLGTIYAFENFNIGQYLFNSFEGTINNYGEMSSNFGSGIINNNGIFNNYGTFEVSFYIYNYGTFNNYETSNIDRLQEQYGIINNHAPLTLSHQFPSLNNGVINNYSTITSNSSFTNSGTIINEVNGTLQINPNLIYTNNGTIINYGKQETFNFNNSGYYIDLSKKHEDQVVVNNNSSGFYGGNNEIITPNGILGFYNNATVAPGISINTQDIAINGFANGIGKLNVTEYTETASATLRIEIDGAATAGENYDQLAVLNTATLNGTLTVSFPNNYIPLESETFTILTANTVTGTFTTVNFPTIPNKSFSLTYNPTSVVINVANVTNVPDDNFENYLETHDANGNVVTLGDASSMGNGIANDNLVFTSRINTIANLNISNLAIADLTGIEAFAMLESFRCRNNNLTTIDISNNPTITLLNGSNNTLNTIDVTNNTALTHLFLDNTGLTTIDITQNTLLRELELSDNNFTTVNLNQNPDLFYLYIDNSGLTTLDVTQNPALQECSLLNNNLSSLDLLQNGALEFLHISNNNVSTINLSNNTILKELDINNNSIATLNLDNNPLLETLNASHNNLTGLSVSSNLNLERLIVNNNSISNLELQGSPALTHVNCSNNAITKINTNVASGLIEIIVNDNDLEELRVKNGNNTNVTSFDALNNPNLMCIEVDDVTYSTTNWMNKDVGATFTVDCHFDETYIPDDNFENYLETHDANGNIVTLGDASSMGNGIANDDYVLTNNIQNITNLTIASLNISDLTGIEAFGALENLDCEGNQLTILNLSTLNSLIELRARINQIASISLPNSNNLSILSIENNLLTSIDLSQNPGLTILDISGGNMLSSLDLTANTLLEELDCDDNNLTTLNLTTNTALTELSCATNQITSLNITGNTLLVALFAEENMLPSIDLSMNPALELANLEQNQLTSINTSANTNLTAISVKDNLMPTVDFSSNTNLEFLDVSMNQISALDVSANTNLSLLHCANNTISSLNLDANEALTDFNCDTNTLSSLSFKMTMYANITNFVATNNVSLTCIDVLNPTYSTTNWTNIDAQTSFNSDCSSTLSTPSFQQDVITIYPNPTDDYITISGLTQTENAEIYTLSGQKILETEIDNTANVINVIHISSGTYFLKIKNTTFKFIKE